jgi:hypothetical protein
MAILPEYEHSRGDIVNDDVPVTVTVTRAHRRLSRSITQRLESLARNFKRLSGG